MPSRLTFTINIPLHPMGCLSLDKDTKSQVWFTLKAIISSSIIAHHLSWKSASRIDFKKAINDYEKIGKDK